MFRRRKEKKTDYGLRLRLLKYGKPRLVVRRSINSIRCQVIEYNEKGDKVIVEAVSNSLKKFGWKAHTGNLASAYLTGMLTGFMALKKGVKEAILDIGLQHSTKGNALYACAAGAADSGLQIPLGKEALPGKERISGRHIAQLAALLKKSPDKYKRQFSGYIKKGVEPEKLEEYFNSTQDKIREEFRDVAKLAQFEDTAKKFLK